MNFVLQSDIYFTTTKKISTKQKTCGGVEP